MEDFDMEAWCEEFSKETYETVKKTHAIAENHFAIGKETNSTVNRCEDMLRLLVEQKKTQKCGTDCQHQHLSKQEGTECIIFFKRQQEETDNSTKRPSVYEEETGASQDEGGCERRTS
mmetsp:Transcript_28333/g.57022  ORF Transcript_28333/g.57022 Transcript_28333/m.57022 type:complete len:118 (-) Transcript_28333:2596-2949(-)